MIEFLQRTALLIAECQLNNKVKSVLLATCNERVTRARLGIAGDDNGQAAGKAQEKLLLGEEKLEVSVSEAPQEDTKEEGRKVTVHLRGHDEELVF